jgi:ABC-type antimicrobial peptide transport system permease subunit
MVAWIIALNVFTLMYAAPPNIILYILLTIFMYLDAFLYLLGPIFFLYGTVKLVTQGSIRLQRKVGFIGRRAFGESGLLATKNVQRNPARNVAIAFLIALVVGYGVMAVGASASNYDYNYRNTYANVGADVSTYLAPSSNVTYLSSQVANISGVSAVTLQRYLYSSTSEGSVNLKAVDPTAWRQVAYYEEDWFRGTSAEQAFQSMAEDNFTIILDSGVASYLSLPINGTIALTFYTPQGDSIYSFRVVGLFGPANVRFGGDIFYSSYYYSAYGSYIPAAVLDSIDTTSSNYQLLVKLRPGANATFTVQEINNIGNTSNTLAASLELESMYSDYFSMGSQNVQNIGIALAFVGASLEIGVVVSITILERRKELTILSVRGMSSRQISSILLIEILSIVGFALALGVLVGLIMILGTVNSTSHSGQLVTQRLSFPLGTVMLILGMVTLVLMAVVIPIVIAARRAPSDARRKGGW